MPEANPAALSFLASRRSRPAKTLTTPVPSRDELQDLLTIAARTPDHGKLEPWRFIVLERAALAALFENQLDHGDRSSGGCHRAGRAVGIRGGGF